MKLGHTIEESKRKYPEITDEQLQTLQKWAEKRGLSGIPQEQLAIFAHSCYYQKDAILQCMDTYYTMKVNCPQLFTKRDPQSECIQHCLKVMESLPLPVLDPNGYRIIFHRLVDTRPNQYIFNDAVKTLLMTIDASLYTDGCMPGYVFLFDMRGVKMGHLTRLSINIIRQFFEYIQEAMPVRLKSIYVVNTVWFMDKVLALIKPFMKKEFIEMIHLYTDDVTPIYEHLPPKCLPKDYGGELDCTKELHEAHCRKFEQLREYFMEEEASWQNYQTLKNVTEVHQILSDLKTVQINVDKKT